MRPIRHVIPFVLAVASPCALAQAPIDVPRGSPALADGRCEAGEWADAAAVPLAGGATLLAKQSGDFVYLCVKPPKETWFGVDLYVSRPGEPPFNLHASAKLGERQWREGKWSDFEWWRQAGWIANTSRGVAFEKREFLPDGAKEFQLRRARLSGEAVRLMVEVHGNDSSASPAGAKSNAPAGWFVLRGLG